MLLAHNLADVWDIVAGSHEVSQVVELQFIITARDDGFAASLDGHHMVRVVGTADVLERLIENFAGFAQFDTQHDEGAIVHIPSLAHPTHLQSVVDIHSGQHLRIDQLVDAQFAEEILSLLVHVFRIIHLGNGALGSELLGKDAGSDVLALQRRYGDEEVGILYVCILQNFQTGRLSQHGEQIIVRTDAGESFLAIINERDILPASGEQSCQMGTYGVCACNNDFHS